MNSFVNDLFERIAGEADKLVNYKGKSTLSSRKIPLSACNSLESSPSTPVVAAELYY
jgi:hypothetical protein